MTEADRTSLFLKYAKINFNYNFVFEAKICKGNSLPFSSVVDHQILNLYQAKHSCWNFKIPDAGFQNPFDGVQFFKTNSFVVIFWYQKRNDRRFTMIDIDKFIEEKQNSDRKSITFERANEIAFFSSSL